MSGTADLIAFGFGSWSTVAKVPTLGFGIGAPLDIIVVPGIEYRLPDQRAHYAATDRRPHFRSPDQRPHYSSRGTD
jgi:hypothetical protein